MTAAAPTDRTLVERQRAKLTRILFRVIQLACQHMLLLWGGFQCVFDGADAGLILARIKDANDCHYVGSSRMASSLLRVSSLSDNLFKT